MSGFTGNADTPAFPSTVTEMVNVARQAGREPVEINYPGLTKREYFALIICANSAMPKRDTRIVGAIKEADDLLKALGPAANQSLTRKNE